MSLLDRGMMIEQNRGMKSLVKSMKGVEAGLKLSANANQKIFEGQKKSAEDQMKAMAASLEAQKNITITEGFQTLSGSLARLGEIMADVVEGLGTMSARLEIGFIGLVDATIGNTQAMIYNSSASQESKEVAVKNSIAFSAAFREQIANAELGSKEFQKVWASTTEEVTVLKDVFENVGVMVSDKNKADQELAAFYEDQRMIYPDELVSKGGMDFTQTLATKPQYEFGEIQNVEKVAASEVKEIIDSWVDDIEKLQMKDIEAWNLPNFGAMDILSAMSQRSIAADPFEEMSPSKTSRLDSRWMKRNLARQGRQDTRREGMKTLTPALLDPMKGLDMVKNNKHMKKFGKELRGSVGSIGIQTQLISALVAPLASFVSGVLAPFSILSDIMGGLGEMLGMALVPIMMKIGEVLMMFMPLMLFLVEALQPIFDLVDLILAPLMEIIPLLIEIVEILLPPLVLIVLALIDPFMSFMQLLDILIPIINIVVSVLIMLMPVVNALIDVFTWIMGLIADYYTIILTTVEHLITKLSDWIAGGREAISGFFTGIVDTIKNWIANIKSAISGVVSDIWESIKTEFGIKMEWWTDFDLWNLIKEKLGI